MNPQPGGTGAGGQGKPLHLTLTPRFDVPRNAARQAERQLEWASPHLAGVGGGAVTASAHRRNDGATETRVTSSLGDYCVRTPAMPQFMSDLPAYRTALPQKCAP